MIAKLHGRLPLFVVLTGATLLLNACADGPNSAYPSLAKINEMGQVLSDEERKQALKELEKEQKSHGDEAEKAIEKR